jgi:hypothetical protein
MRRLTLSQESLLPRSGSGWGGFLANWTAIVSHVFLVGQIVQLVWQQGYKAAFLQARPHNQTPRSCGTGRQAGRLVPLRW